VVSFMPLPLCPWYSLDRSLVEPQSLCGSCREEKNLAPAGSQTPPTQLIAHYIQTELPQLSNKFLIRYNKGCTLPSYLICKRLSTKTTEIGTHTNLSLHEDITLAWNQGVEIGSFWQIDKT
jgi:hypothetical protein